MNKKDDILKTALKLFVEFGFHATPTSKIAKEAGVANGTLFYYFKTKNDLILTIYRLIKSNQTAFIYGSVNSSDSFKMMLKTVFNKSIEWALYNNLEYLFLQQFSRSPLYELITTEEKKQLTKPHLNFLEQGVKTSALKSMPVELLYTLVNSHIDGVNQYLTSNNLSTTEQQEITNEAFDLLGL